MSKIGFYLLLPAITFVKVAEAVDASVLREWWPLAANLCFSILLGAALGYAGSYLVRTPPQLRRTVVVASSIGNINTIPLLVVASLCQSDDLMFNEVLGNTCSTRGIAYVAVGMAVGSVFHHSIAFHMLKPPRGHQELLAAAGGTPGTRRSNAGGGGAGGGNLLGPPPPPLPSDATAIVVRPPLPLAPRGAHCSECKHCGAPCLEEEDAETGGRRVSYAPTLATTGDGGFHGTGGDDGDGGGDDDGDRRSSVSSWLSDDMFCGLETLSEAFHFVHTPHSTAKGLHHGLHWGNRDRGAGAGGRPATPAPFARSASNAALHAAAVRRSRHSAPETCGDEIKSPRGDTGSRGASMPGGGGGQGGAAGAEAQPRQGAASLESTLTAATMARAVSSHVPGSLASAAAAAAATGLHPSVFEHPSSRQDPAAVAAPPRRGPPSVVMLSADAASLASLGSREEVDAAAAAAAAAVAGDGSDPLPFGGRLAAITTTQSHEPGNGKGDGGGDGRAAPTCRACSDDGEKGDGGGGANNRQSQSGGHLHHRRRSLSMTSGGDKSSSSSTTGDVPVGSRGGQGGGRGGGGGAKDSASRLHSSSRLKGALAAAWNFLQPLRALLWVFFRPIFLTLAFIERMLPVPAIISLAGIGVGCCPPLKRLLFAPKAPLEFVAHSLHTISGATVPVMSFILGAVLYRGPGKAKVPKRVLAGVILIRLVLVPVLGALAVIYAERAHWFRPVDPLFMFTLVREREREREEKKKEKSLTKKIVQKMGENLFKKTAPPRDRPDGDQHAGHRDHVPVQRGRDGRSHLLAARGLPRLPAAVHLRVRRAPFKKNELSFPRNLEKKTHLSFNSTLWKKKTSQNQMHVLDGQAPLGLDGGRGPQEDRRGDQRPRADALKKKGGEEVVERR